jgi:hypothetical protein
MLGSSRLIHVRLGRKSDPGPRKLRLSAVLVRFSFVRAGAVAQDIHADRTYCTVTITGIELSVVPDLARTFTV